MNFIKYIFSNIKHILSEIFTFIFYLSWEYIVVCFLALLIITIASQENQFYVVKDSNQNDYCNLTDVTYVARLQDTAEHGSIVEVVEYITFDVHAASPNNPFKELWRELPEEVVDGLRTTYDVKSVTQILDDGEEIVYTETPKMYWEDYDYTPSTTMYWHHSDGSGSYPDNDESLLIYIPWTYRDELTFRITYTINGAVLKYNDCAELYLSMYSGSDVNKLKSYKAQILIPDELMPSTYYVYTYGTSNINLPYHQSNTAYPGYSTFSINLDKSQLVFNSTNEYIEFSLLAYGNDKHIFAKYATPNDYTDDNALAECIEENTYYSNINLYYLLLKLAIFIIAIFISYTLIKKTKKEFEDLKPYKPAIEYEYFRDIPSDLDPVFAAKLVFMKLPFQRANSIENGCAAALLSLVRKKYISIVDCEPQSPTSTSSSNSTPEQEIRIEASSTWLTSSSISSSQELVYKTVNVNTGEILEPLTISEKLYYDLILTYASGKNSITLRSLRSHIRTGYSYIASFIRNMEILPPIDCGVNQGYFQSADYDKIQQAQKKSETHSVVTGFALLIIVNLFLCLTPLSLCYGAFIILGLAFFWRGYYKASNINDTFLFTEYGVNEQAKWFGLYNFLNSNTLISEKDIDDITLWEKYLVYATAFGLSDKVIHALKINITRFSDNVGVLLKQNSFIRSSSYRAISRSFRRSANHATSSSRRFGSSFGGGRGGGGGGGGH